MKRTYLYLLSTSIFLLLSHGSSWAATLSGTIYFWDSRTDRDDDSKLPQSTSQTNQLVHELKLWIYDMDGACIDNESGCSETDDDFLKTVYTDTSGYFSTTINDGEDVYIINKYENIHGQVQNENGTLLVTNSYLLASNISGSQTRTWNITCTQDSNGLCNNQSQIDASYTMEEDFSNILVSIYNGASFFENNLVLNLNGIDYDDGREFIAFYPDRNGECEGVSGKNWNPQDFCIADGVADDNHIIAHEMGHALHRRALNITTDPYYLSESSCNGIGSWTYTTTGSPPVTNGEKCVLSEGFASFVSGAIYWEQDAYLPWYAVSTQYLEGNTTQGNSTSSKCVSILNNPYLARGNASRWFWDLYDSTTNGTSDTSEDTLNESFEDIVLNWEDFPSGYSNRYNRESGDSGRNAYDYEYYWSASLDTLTHNCLEDQVP